MLGDSAAASSRSIKKVQQVLPNEGQLNPFHIMSKLAMKMNIDFVLTSNSQGRYFNLLSITNNARHFDTEFSGTEYFG